MPALATQQLGKYDIHCIRQFCKLPLGNGEGRRQIDDRAERPDKNAFSDKSLPQSVEIFDAVEFDHADGARTRTSLTPRRLRQGSRPRVRARRDICAT